MVFFSKKSSFVAKENSRCCKKSHWGDGSGQISVVSGQFSVIGELGGLGGNCIKRAIKRNYQARWSIEDVEVPLRGTSLSRSLSPSCEDLRPSCMVLIMIAGLRPAWPLRGHFCFWYSFPHTGLAADSCCSLRQAKGFTNYANCLVSPGRVHDPASLRSCRKTEGW